MFPAIMWVILNDIIFRVEVSYFDEVPLSILLGGYTFAIMFF